MENLQQQIHLRNIVSCLNEVKDYAHYLSYERFTSDQELKNIIFRNLDLAAHEADNLHNQGSSLQGLDYLRGLHNLDSTADFYSIYHFLKNDVDFLTSKVTEACRAMEQDAKPDMATSFA